MKLLSIKVLLILCAFSCISFITAKKAEARAPDITGRVVTAGTNAPVAGVWVKWTDEWGWYRIAQTDSTGAYTFSGLSDMTAAQIQTLQNTFVDATNNGTKDTPELYDTDTTDILVHFSCGDNPHAFSVIQPVGANGTFSTVSGVDINNGANSIAVSDIIFTPSILPTPTPNPVRYTISGNVFVDLNTNGVKDNAETNYQNVIVQLSTGAQMKTDATGNYSFTNLPVGQYTVQITLPSGYNNTTPVSKSVTLP